MINDSSLYNIKSTVSILSSCILFILTIQCRQTEADISKDQTYKPVIYTEVNINSANIDGNFFDVQFASEETGFIVGASKKGTFTPALFITKNHGINWQQVRADTTIKTGFITVQSLTDSLLFAFTTNISVPKYSLLISEDQGDTWRVLSDTLTPIFNIIHFFNRTVGIGVGPSGVHRTVDGGKSWVNNGVKESTFPGLSLLQFLDANVGYAAGGLSFNDRPIGGGKTNYGSLWRTTDSGLSWSDVLPQFGNVIAMHFLTGKKGFVATADKELYSTYDGGESWQLITKKYPVDNGDLFFFSEKEGLALGQTSLNSAIYRTIDGGLTWQSDYKIDINPSIKSVQSFWLSKDSRVGYAVGRGATIVRIDLN